MECYGGELNQVFMNILANAIDALEEWTIENAQLRIDNLTFGLLTPTIAIHTSVIDSGWVKIAIADNGIGMSEQIQKQVFNPFFINKPVGKVTGMGMFISYQIITETHGGKLECHSTPAAKQSL